MNPYHIFQGILPITKKDHFIADEILLFSLSNNFVIMPHSLYHIARYQYHTTSTVPGWSGSPRMRLPLLSLSLTSNISLSTVSSIIRLSEL